MAKVYTSSSDEDTIVQVLRKGFMAQGHKWTVFRVALALSLKQSTPPDEAFDSLDGGKDGEYTLEVLTGKSQKEPDGFVDAFKTRVVLRGVIVVDAAANNGKHIGRGQVLSENWLLK